MPVQDRQQERRGLAGAGVGAADQIVAAHDDRNDRALDRRRRGESANANAFDERGFEAEGVETDRACGSYCACGRVTTRVVARHLEMWRDRAPPGRGPRRPRRPRGARSLCCM